MYGQPLRADDPALDVAESTPVEDSVYPLVGDPGVDALSYDLDLAWTARTRTLTAVETLVFRSTTDADRFQTDDEAWPEGKLAVFSVTSTGLVRARSAVFCAASSAMAAAWVAPR